MKSPQFTMSGVLKIVLGFCALLAAARMGYKSATEPAGVMTAGDVATLGIISFCLYFATPTWRRS
jgi:hypothetical protein